MGSLHDITQKILALPREAGTPEAAAARELVADHLELLGYEVVVQKFSFSPASLKAFPLFGDGLGLLALILFPLLGTSAVPAWAALAVWAGGLAVLSIAAAGIGLGWVPLGEAAREDANLIATRPGDRPRRWVVAHLDTKAQAHSMAGRLVAVWVTGGAIVVLTAMVAVRLGGRLSPGWLAIGCGAALLAGFLARRGRLKGRTVGARDNGTGLVAVLAAAESAPSSGLGILITGAEEFGLVGARVFARVTPDIRASEFVNVDTVDDEGTLYLVSHDAKGEHLARAVEPLLAATTGPVRRRRLPLGIFVDSAPLAQAHASAITIGRLTWQTLRRIHTTADTVDGLSLTTAEAVGKAIALN
ncbi:MAG: M28 family peptidase [Gemmatimonadales bacterium]